MAKDPAVSSIEVDCLCSLERADMSLPESDDSFPGDQHDTRDRYQVEGVARRLSVQVGAPWGIDRIDTNGEPAVRSWRRPQLWLAHISAQSAPRQPGWRSSALPRPRTQVLALLRQAARSTANTTTAT